MASRGGEVEYLCESGKYGITKSSEFGHLYRQNRTDRCREQQNQLLYVCQLDESGESVISNLLYILRIRKESKQQENASSEEKTPTKCLTKGTEKALAAAGTAKNFTWQSRLRKQASQSYKYAILYSHHN